MKSPLAEHVVENSLELYAMDRLPETELAPVEEHLLVCHECQDRLEATVAYLKAMRGAARRVSEPSKTGWPAWWRPALAMAAAAVLLAVVGLRTQPHAGVPVAVMLRAIRGSIPVHAQVPARRPLSLSLDLTDLAAFPAYKVEVVNETGRPVWAGVAVADTGHTLFIGVAGADGGRVAAVIPPLLSKGRYYVRLYSPSADLLREYGLEVN